MTGWLLPDITWTYTYFWGTSDIYLSLQKSKIAKSFPYFICSWYISTVHNKNLLRKHHIITYQLSHIHAMPQKGQKDYTNHVKCKVKWQRRCWFIINIISYFKYTITITIKILNSYLNRNIVCPRFYQSINQDKCQK